jgi:hypothetical protein
MDPLGQNAIRQTPIKNINKSKTISVIKIVDAIGYGKPVGKYYGGTGCFYKEKLMWSGGVKIINHLSDIARIELDKYGYSLVDKIDSPFNEEYSKRADLLLGGKLVDVKWNGCFSVKGDKGEMYIKVKWEIYDNITRIIALTISTEGYFSVKEFNRFGQKELLDKAFNMAIDNLLADEAFHAFLTEGK